MKCSNCQYLCYPEYESNYSECSIFGAEPPEDHMLYGDDGCTYTEKELREICEQNEAAWLKDKEEFVKWFEENL